MWKQAARSKSENIMLRGKLQFYAFLTSWNHAFQNVAKAEERLALQDTRKSKDRAPFWIEMNREHFSTLIASLNKSSNREPGERNMFMVEISSRVHTRDPALTQILAFLSSSSTSQPTDCFSRSCKKPRSSWQPQNESTSGMSSVSRLRTLSRWPVWKMRFCPSRPCQIECPHTPPVAWPAWSLRRKIPQASLNIVQRFVKPFFEAYVILVSFARPMKKSCKGRQPAW